MVIRYFKTTNDTPFYKYSFLNEKELKNKKQELMSSNDDLSSSDHIEISHEEYNILINKMLSINVIS